MNFDLEEEVPPPRLLNETEESKAEGINTRRSDHLTQRLRTPRARATLCRKRNLNSVAAAAVPQHLATAPGRMCLQESTVYSGLIFTHQSLKTAFLF